MSMDHCDAGADMSIWAELVEPDTVLASWSPAQCTYTARTHPWYWSPDQSEKSNNIIDQSEHSITIIDQSEHSINIIDQSGDSITIIDQ